jgi:diadenosine tetraphosphatase ApaH/serine/threonine PP2A family protein phosphatase
MRVAIISDIHGNLPALESVLEAIDTAGVEEIWCLGDVVGYGAQPDACTDLVKERSDICLVGNHDLAVLGKLDISAFSSAAATAARWTAENCEPSTIEFLAGLKAESEREEVGLFHASPRDPVWEYVLSLEQAAECLDVAERRLNLIGHSHVALFFNRNGQVRGAQAGADASLDLREDSWLINPGSVGQPRDGDPRAAWLELDTGDASALYRRVEYDVDKAAEPILEAGLPSHLADRLYLGQ